MKRAVVIAHFHAGGLVQAHLRTLVRALLALDTRIVLVSTSASPEAIRTLPGEVRPIVRPNVGYDFESYRVGIASLGDLGAWDEVVLLNSSIVCIDAAKLCRGFFCAPRPEAEVFGLTASREFSPHVQSFLVGFSRRALVSQPFAAWWRDLQAFDDREEVIGRCELAMSAHFARHGFRLGAAFRPTPAQKFRALCRYLEALDQVPPITADGKVSLDLAAADALNPMHFLWDAIFDQFGVLKAELLRRNPYSLDLRPITRLLMNDVAFRQLVADVFEEPAAAH